MGDKCELTCPPGTYGRNCKQTCNCNEGNTVSCDSVTGECKCKDDWNGTYGVFQKSLFPEFITFELTSEFLNKYSIFCKFCLIKNLVFILET